MPLANPRIVFLDSATLSAPITPPDWPHRWQSFGATNTGDQPVRGRVALGDNRAPKDQDVDPGIGVARAGVVGKP